MIPTAQLLKQAEMMSDLEFLLDFHDCVLPLCDPFDRKTLLDYANRRKKRPGFQARIREQRLLIAYHKKQRLLAKQDKR